MFRKYSNEVINRANQPITLSAFIGVAVVTALVMMAAYLTILIFLDVLD